MSVLAVGVRAQSTLFSLRSHWESKGDFLMVTLEHGLQNQPATSALFESLPAADSFKARLWPHIRTESFIRILHLNLRLFGSHVPDDGFGARIHMQLFKNVLQMAADSVDAQLQFVGDQFVGIPLREQQENLFFTDRQSHRF